MATANQNVYHSIWKEYETGTNKDVSQVSIRMQKERRLQGGCEGRYRRVTSKSSIGKLVKDANIRKVVIHKSVHDNLSCQSFVPRRRQLLIDVEMQVES